MKTDRPDWTLLEIQIERLDIPWSDTETRPTWFVWALVALGGEAAIHSTRSFDSWLAAKTWARSTYPHTKIRSMGC